MIAKEKIAHTLNKSISDVKASGKRSYSFLLKKLETLEK
jgi:hypothetical protein